MAANDFPDEPILEEIDWASRVFGIAVLLGIMYGVAYIVVKVHAPGLPRVYWYQGRECQ